MVILQILVGKPARSWCNFYYIYSLVSRRPALTLGRVSAVHKTVYCGLIKTKPSSSFGACFSPFLLTSWVRKTFTLMTQSFTLMSTLWLTVSTCTAPLLIANCFHASQMLASAFFHLLLVLCCSQELKCGDYCCCFRTNCHVWQNALLKHTDHQSPLLHEAVTIDNHR